MPVVLSMVPLHSLVQYDQNVMQLDIFGYVMPLALVLASTDADGIVNGTIIFVMSR